MKKLMMLLCVLAGFNNLAAMQVEGKDADANTSTSDKKVPQKSGDNIGDDIWHCHNTFWAGTVLELTKKMEELANKKAADLVAGLTQGDDEKQAVTRILLESMRAAHQEVTAFQQAIIKISDTNFVKKVRDAHAQARTHVMDQFTFKTFDSIQAVVTAIKTFGAQAVKDTDALVKEFYPQGDVVVIAAGGEGAASGASDAEQTA